MCSSYVEEIIIEKLEQQQRITEIMTGIITVNHVIVKCQSE